MCYRWVGYYNYVISINRGNLNLTKLKKLCCLNWTTNDDRPKSRYETLVSKNVVPQTLKCLQKVVKRVVIELELCKIARENKILKVNKR